MAARRRLLPVGLAVAGLVSSITACGGADPAPSSTGATSEGVKSIKLVAAEYSPATGPFWQKAASDFESQTGIHVNVQVVGWKDIHQQVSTMVQTNQVPDVLNLDSFSQYAADDLLLPADDIETPALKANIPANLADSGAYRGTRYALPFIGSSSTLFYNPQILTSAGIAKPPTTMDELAADAKQISARTGKVGLALSLGPEAPQIDYSMVMFNMGGNYKNGDTWTLNSPQNVAALQWIKNLADAKATEINPGNTGRVEGTWQLFEAGTAGMVIGQGGLEARLKKSNTPYKTTPFPAAAGVTPTSLGIADYLMAFKKDGNTEPVKKFLDFVMAKERYSAFVQSEQLLPVTSDVQTALAQDASFGPYIAALKAATFAPVGDPMWDKVLGAMKNTLGTGVSSDPSAALGQIQQVATGS